MAGQVRRARDHLEGGAQLLLDVLLTQSFAHEDLFVAHVLGAHGARVGLASPPGALVGLQAGKVGRSLGLGALLEVGRRPALELDDVRREAVNAVGQVRAEVQGKGLRDEAVVGVVVRVQVVVVRVFGMVGGPLVPFGGQVHFEEALTGDLAVGAVAHIASGTTKSGQQILYRDIVYFM